MPTRAATPVANGRPAKKPRLCSTDYFEDTSKEIEWSEIERVLASMDAEDAEPGWISGDVFMVFSSKQKSEAQLRLGKMQLRISVICPEYQLFKFEHRQSLKVSLRGANIARSKTGTSVPGYMSFYLLFKEGASVKFVNGGKSVEDGTVVDTWQEKQNSDNAQKDGDWFIFFPEKAAGEQLSSPVRPSSEQAASSSSHSSPFPETPGRSAKDIPCDSSITISNGGGQEEELALDLGVEDLVQHMNVSKEKTPAHESNSNDRHSPATVQVDKKLKKRETRHDHLREVIAASNSDSGEAGHPKGPKLSRAEKKRRQRQQAQVAEQSPPEPPKRNPALDLVAGISSEAGAYSPLDTLRANTFVHVIGIVTSIEEPSITRKGDFSLSVILADPSNFQGGTGFKVVCFMKPGFEHLLPSSLRGHVLLLQDVKTAEWHGRINGTVYPYKLKWVGYNPETGKVYSAEERGVGSPARPVFSTAYRPKDCEVRYFVQLSEWWQAVKKEEEHGTIHIADYSRKRREHQLFGSCGVGQFFNATVEILRLEEAESGQTTIFFTDYTANPLRSNDGYYGQWAMHASTSRIESWLLDTVKPGTYWSIKNMRLKFGSTENLEAELYEARLHEIDSGQDDMHLRELLKRKEAYLREHPQNPEQGDVSDCAISDISRAGHYTIVAVLVYRTKPRDAVTDLYVTDYTDNPSLSSYKPEGLKRQLNGLSLSVLQISTWDGEELVREMDIGGVYTFSDVRIRQQDDGGLKGNLKFADKRITQMKVKNTDNTAVLALLMRKKEYTPSDSADRQNATSPLDMPIVQRPSITISSAIKSRHTDQRKSTIAEIKATEKCPNKFRLVARIVGFFPTDISDFAVRLCSNCSKRIPDNYNACLSCEDFMQVFVKWLFKFAFLLEDGDGEKLLVTVDSEAKYLLRGLKPCDLKENHNALWAVKRRLQDCMGNLVDVYERLKCDEVIEPQYGPYFDLALKSWQVVGGDRNRRIFELTGCEVPQQRNC